MLAQNFKTPTDLGITDAEFDALHQVLGMLERGELIHDARKRGDQPNGFNMDCWGRKTDCGTVACIAGWARLIGGQELFSNFDSAVGRLFQVDNMNGTAPVSWAQITTDHAASALRNYLTHGEPRWKEAIAG